MQDCCHLPGLLKPGFILQLDTDDLCDFLSSDSPLCGPFLFTVSLILYTFSIASDMRELPESRMFVGEILGLLLFLGFLESAGFFLVHFMFFKSVVDDLALL